MSDLPIERKECWYEGHHLCIQGSTTLDHCLLNLQEKPDQTNQFRNDMELHLRA